MSVPIEVCTSLRLSRKTAATRYDREVDAGRIDYFDVADRAGVDVNDYDIAELKRDLRAGLRAPSQPSESSLNLTRRLSESALSPTSERQLQARVGPYQRNSHGFSPSQGASYTYDPTSYRAEFDGRIHIGGNSPAMLRSVSDGGVDRARAAFAVATQGRAREVVGSLAQSNPRVSDLAARAWLSIAPPPANRASDSTLRRAVMLHEVGEQSDLLGQSPQSQANASPWGRSSMRQPAPHSSHVGVTPLVNERIALRGDPAAFADMQAAREVNTGDVLAAKRYTQMGGTYDRPIPLQSRQHRALERAVAGDFDLLPRGERLPVFARSAFDGASHGEAPSLNRSIDQWGRSLNDAVRQVTGAIPPAPGAGRFDAVRQSLSDVPRGLQTLWRYVR